MPNRLTTAGVLVLVVAAATTTPALTPATASAAPQRRVDLGTPTFSNPTDITNPLFGVSALDQVIQLGAEGDVVLRHDITTLDRTRVITWNGQQVETVVSQFMAYGDGEVLEVALDYFAQADDGSVWYFGEDVINYADGEIADYDGTWLAGRDGPAGMIMPADPQVGDVYRPENIPGLVFEEVTVQQVGVTVDGPTGPVDGAIVVKEELLDGTLEDKTFAPGYGEFIASVPTSDELVTVAVATPTDAGDTRAPRALDRLSDTATELYRAAQRRHSRPGVVQLAERAHRQADALNRSGEVPPLLTAQLDDVLVELDAAAAARSRKDVKQAAIDLELAVLDIEMLVDDRAGIDRDRIEVWQLQRRLHLADGDTAAAASDAVIIAAIKDRIAG